MGLAKARQEEAELCSEALGKRARPPIRDRGGAGPLINQPAAAGALGCVGTEPATSALLVPATGLAPLLEDKLIAPLFFDPLLLLGL